MSAVVAQAKPAQDDTRYNVYPYIIITDTEGAADSISDEDFFDKSARVIFPINKYNLPTGDKTLTQLEQEVIPMLNQDSLQLVRLIIRGAASPEGPQAWNKTLGERRAKSLFDFLEKRLKFPIDDSRFSIDIDIEDYGSLCQMMKRANDPNYDYVKSLVDQYLPTGQLARLKQQLRAAQQGKLWRYLFTTYFPNLRAARIVMVMRKIKQPKPAVPQRDLSDNLTERNTTPDIPVQKEPEIPKPEWEPRREVLSVKTNLLFYGVYVPGYDRWCPIPNVAIEYYPLRGHFTFGASFDMPWWQDYDGHKYFQLRNYQLETRYYLRSGDIRKNPLGKGAAFRGLYLQAYVGGGLFGICFDENRGWVGEGLGAGVGLGYVLPISRKGHWRLEFQLQVGYFTCKYDPYQYENAVDPDYHDDLYYYKWTLAPDLFRKRQYRFNWIGPTRVGITLSYDLFYRPNHKRGISLRYKERRAEQ
jgi:hypothetical protein